MVLDDKVKAQTAEESKDETEHAPSMDTHF